MKKPNAPTNNEAISLLFINGFVVSFLACGFVEVALLELCKRFSLDGFAPKSIKSPLV